MIRVLRSRMLLALFTGLVAVSSACAQAGGGTAQGGAVSGGGGTATGVGSGTGATGVAASTFAGAVNTGFSGGTAASTTANKGAGGTANSVPSKNNPWQATYANPYAIGQSLMSSGGKTTTTTKAFGQPVYATTTTTGGMGGQGGANASAANGFTSVGQIKAPRYSTALAEDVPFATFSSAKIESTARDTIARSTYFKNREAIQVAVREDAVVLTGQVASDRERRNAESLLRISGIRNVDNRLTVVGAGQ